MKAFLYRLKLNMLEVFEGEITPMRIDGIKRHRDHARFEFVAIPKTIRWVVWKDPEIVYRGMVWLPERNDNKAMNLIISDLKSKRKNLQLKMEEIDGLIEMLGEEIKK